MILTTLARAAFAVLDIVGPQTPPPPPPAAVVVRIVDNRPVAIPGKITDGPVPCNQMLADGTVYCGEPGGETRPAPAVPEGPSQVIDTRDGFSAETGPGLMGADAEYQNALAEMYYAIRPWAR